MSSAISPPTSPSKSKPKPAGAPASNYAKQIVLVILVLHNSTTILITRYTRSTPEQKQYSVACSVIFTEVCKLLICASVLLVTEGSLRSCYADVRELAKTSVPAILFFIQNNVMYLALGNLDAATFQVTMQLRLITTAVMSTLLLNKHLSSVQWASLFLLAAGVAVVQVSSINSSQQVDGNRAIGFAAVLFNCCCSAFGAVYFEKLLKGSQVSLWTRNVQLAVFSICVGVVDLLCNGELVEIEVKGYFHGFTELTFVVIALQSAGGILLALVMKYADNILKGFAMAIAILVSCLASVVFFDFVVTSAYIAGCGMVISAATIYARAPSLKHAQVLLLDLRTTANDAASKANKKLPRAAGAGAVRACISAASAASAASTASRALMV